MNKKKCFVPCFLTRFLYTNELNKIARTDKILNAFYLGAFPADIFPPISKKTPCCWIWNTDEQSEDGRHWVAIWVDEKTMYFFDSFAKPLSFYKREYWRKYAKKINRKFKIVRTRQLQAKNTFVCGNWSLLYLHNMSRGKKDKIKINNKLKIRNDIQLSKIIRVKFGEIIQKTYSEKCKSKKQQQKCTTLNDFNKKLFT